MESGAGRVRGARLRFDSRVDCRRRLLLFVCRLRERCRRTARKLIEVDARRKRIGTGFPRRSAPARLQA
jgi:hypothetical protein